MTAHTHKIIRWSATNPGSVERAFRIGYLMGARCSDVMKEKAAIDLICDLCGPPVDYSISKMPDYELNNTSSAMIRGFCCAVRDISEWRMEGGGHKSLQSWLSAVYAWAYELPLSKEESKALPPSIGKWTRHNLIGLWSKPKTHWRNQK